MENIDFMKVSKLINIQKNRKSLGRVWGRRWRGVGGGVKGKNSNFLFLTFMSNASNSLYLSYKEGLFK